MTEDDHEIKSHDHPSKHGAEGSDIVGRHYASRRRIDKVDYKSSHLWLVSFTDVMALMLTFFVLLFAMSKPESKTWLDMTKGFQSHLSRYDGVGANRGYQEQFDPARINYSRALDLSYLKAVLQAAIEDDEELDVVTIIPQSDHLILSLPEDLLFAPGRVDVTEEGREALYALGGALSRIKNQVGVIGHSDPRPVQGRPAEGYNNNWELSLARAMAAAAVLRDVGYEKDIAARGFSSGRYQDLEGAISDENRRLDLSRRVDIIVMNHDGIKRKSFFSLGLP